MLPKTIEQTIDNILKLPGVGKKSGQKLALDLLLAKDNDFSDLIDSIILMKKSVNFCPTCGFFCEKTENDPNQLCEICLKACSGDRDSNKICLVLIPTDVLNLEKTQIYNGLYHVLGKLISPLDNVFVQDTALPELINGRIPELIKNQNPIELIIFLKPSFSTDATIAYIRGEIIRNNWENIVTITQLAQGLPLYYNSDNLDQATMIKALEDRKVLF